MKREKMKSLFKQFIIKISNLLRKRHSTTIASGFIIGFLLGVIIFFFLNLDISSTFLVLIGAFIGVFAEIVVDFFEKSIEISKQLRPLNKILGSIAEDDVWIYVSAWVRDLQDAEHSILYRNDHNLTKKVSIIGTQYVYGKGDAIALSYLHQMLAKIHKYNKSISKILVEDSEQMDGSWGRSAICLGTHNSKTREILNKFSNTYFSFSNNYSSIIKVGEPTLTNPNGQVFTKGVFRNSPQDSSEIDYAIILKLKDEYFPEKNILIIAGLGDIGTAGGAFYLLTHHNELPLEEETFGVLIEVPSGYESARRVEVNEVAKYYV